MNALSHIESNLQKFYQTHAALVSSPFITREGRVNSDLLESVGRAIGLRWDSRPFLDLGCGTGLLSTFAGRKPGIYIGLDLNRHALFHALQGGSIHFAQGSSLSLPMRDESIGLLACVDSFEHYPDHRAAAGEMYRVLRADGQIFLSVPTYSNVAGWVKKRMEASGKYAPNTWAPFDYWKPEEYEFFITPDHIRTVFSQAGFKHFSFTGLAAELVYGLAPWLWHPKCPPILEQVAIRVFRLFAKPVTRLFPHWSLHTVWRIEK